MANVNFNGMKELQKLFSDNANQIDVKTDEILTTNAEIVTQYQIGQAYTEGLIDTGSMIDNIKPTSIKVKKGVKQVSVYSQGKDSNGISNARKAYILNYGKSSFPATRWVTKANQSAEGALIDNTKKIFYE